MAKTSAFELILYAEAHGFASREEVPEGWNGPDFGAREALLARIEAALPAMARSDWSEMGPGKWSILLSCGGFSLSFELPEEVGTLVRLSFTGDLVRALPVMRGLYTETAWGVVDQESARLNDPEALARSVAEHLATAKRRAARPVGSPSLLQRIKSVLAR
ncbi:MAG: hypothetical protein AAGA15_07275 [Pseudomonadota bacterium]